LERFPQGYSITRQLLCYLILQLWKPPIEYPIGTPLVLHATARVSLWPTAKSVGLLLNRSEFNEVVKRYERKLNLHPDLLVLFFDLTGGHVGAVVDLLSIVSCQVILSLRTYTSLSLLSKFLQRVAETRQFTVEDFYTENPLHTLIQNLQGRVFTRGLPIVSDFSKHPDTVAVFKSLIRDGELEKGVENEEVIDKCHRFGWIYASMDPSSSEIRYSFASPLHAAYISWIVQPSNDMPWYPSAFDLCIAVISKFKPSQMHIPIRRVGVPSAKGLLPEAQYQDEFYRSLFSATAGNVRISPEFASAKEAQPTGRIDFFVPTVKWGIEITRNGDRLWEHNSRFEYSGAYGAWLQSGDMTDYIFLDCRTTVPRTGHPSTISDFQNKRLC